jgi:aminopeptidase N
MSFLFYVTDMATRADLVGALLLTVTMVAAVMPNSRHEAKVVAASNNSYRLPKTVTPISYDLYLKPNFGSFEFDGDVRIRVQVQEETDNITLHSNVREIKSVEVRDSASAPIEINNTTDSEKHFLTISSDTSFETNEYDIRIEFTGDLSDDMNGFYRSSYTIDGNTR